MRRRICSRFPPARLRSTPWLRWRGSSLSRGPRSRTTPHQNPVRALEDAGPLLRPALYDDLLVGVELDRVAPLSVEISEEAALPTAEGEKCDWGCHPDIDADVADLRLVAKLARRCSAARKQTRLVAVARSVHNLNRLVDILDLDQAKHWTKNLGLGDFAFWIHAAQYRWSDEVTPLIPSDPCMASVDQNSCSLFYADVHELLDTGLRFGGNHRAHLDSRVQPVADNPRLGGSSDRIRKHPAGITDGDRDRRCKAALSGATEGGVCDDLRGHIHLRVREDDHRVLCSTLRLRALSVRRRLAVHVPGDGRGSHEAHGAHRGMFKQGVNRLLRSVHQIHHPARQAGLLDEAEHPLHGDRNFLRRLEDKGVPAGERVRQKPEWDHARKVEWRDRGDHAQRLANHQLVDTSGNVLAGVSLHQHRNAASDLDILDAPAKLADCLG